ncbi:hypothetical protein CY35_04G039500 [Sphagnum magellanicum]|nr:hypothetical protein CY35_04G039500 [Sphagnum magellanicum]
MRSNLADETRQVDPDLSTVAPKCPVTYKRVVATHDIDRSIPKPHVPRALKAVDVENPIGTPGHDPKGLSVLQQHVAFFDRNDDGIIYPWETFEGFRAIGFNLLFSFWAMVLINGSFSWVTLDSWIPSLLFPIYIKNIHKAKHGSDSGVYDTEGRFVPEKFEELFSKFAKTEKTRLTPGELWEMTEANRCVMDPFGWTAEKLEWFAVYLLLMDRDGYVPKEGIRGQYDGTIFKYIERENQMKKIQKKRL